MSERTSSPALNRTVTAEQKRSSLAERVWQGTNNIVRGQLNHAALRIRDTGEQLSPERVVRLARATQERRLQDANIDDWTTGELTANRTGLLTLEMPAHAKATLANDEKIPATQPEKEARRNTTIRFNHDFVETLVAMPSVVLKEFPDRVWQNARDIYDRMNISILPKRRFDGVTKGLTREVAFSRALLSEAPEEWETRNGTLEEDGKGIDAVVEANGVRLNFDMKAAKKYLITLEKYYREGRITTEAYEAGIAGGHANIPMRGKENYNVCVVDADRLGDIDTFEYKDPTVVVEFVEARLNEQRQQILQNIAEHAINN